MLDVNYGSSLAALVKLLLRVVPLLTQFGFEIVDDRDFVNQLDNLTATKLKWWPGPQMKLF